jgi:hypothetical protein
MRVLRRMIKDNRKLFGQVRRAELKFTGLTQNLGPLLRLL